jgi:hypothetical protein
MGYSLTENGYRKLVDENASVIGYVPDLHGNAEGLRDFIRELKKRNEGKQVYVVLGDMDSKTDRIKYIQEHMEDMDLAPPEYAVSRYILEDVLKNDFERENFQLFSAVEQNGGISNYLNILKNEYGADFQQLSRAKQDYEAAKSFVEKNKLLERVEGHSDKINEIGLEAKIKHMALDNAMKVYNAQRIGEVIAEEGVTAIVEPGNHTDLGYVGMLKQIAGDDKVVMDYELGGAIELGSGENKMRFQAASNVYGISHHSDSFAYTPEEIQALYPWMYSKTMGEDLTGKDVSLEDAIESEEYKRITAGGTEDENLDFLLLHSEIGFPNGFDKSRQIYPNLDDKGIVYLAEHMLNPYKGHKGGVVFDGHIHSDNEGEKEGFNHYNIRMAYAMISKVNGKLNVEKFESANTRKEAEGYDEKILVEYYRAYYEDLKRGLAQLKAEKNKVSKAA